MKKFNMRKVLATSMIAGVAFTAFATGATAGEQETKSNTVNFGLISGGIELQTPEVLPFGDITLKPTPETYHTSFEGSFNVKDLTGTQDGWRLDVSATPFTSTGDLAHELPTGSFSMDNVSNITRVEDGTGTLPSKSYSGIKEIDGGVVNVAAAAKGEGAGVFDISFDKDNLSLEVDSTTAKTDPVEPGGKTKYVSTLTWDLVQAP